MDRYKDQNNASNRPCDCGDRYCCCDSRQNSEIWRQPQVGTTRQHFQSAGNMPSTSRYQRDGASFECMFTSSNDPVKLSLNFSPADIENCQNFELNNAKSYSGKTKTTMDKENLLIEDTYDPGLIEDSVECKKDFNAVSFGLMFESIQHIPKQLPPKTPMSLIEAFHKRLDYERNHLIDSTTASKDSRKLTTKSVQAFFANKPKNHLNNALKNLFKAEAIFEERKAPKKGKKAPKEQPYKVEIHQTATPIVGGAPILVETLFGTTKPKKKPKRCC